MMMKISRLLGTERKRENLQNLHNNNNNNCIFVVNLQILIMNKNTKQRKVVVQRHSHTIGVVFRAVFFWRRRRSTPISESLLIDRAFKKCPTLVKKRKPNANLANRNESLALTKSTRKRMLMVQKKKPVKKAYF
jgi:hypothetical protein